MPRIDIDLFARWHEAGLRRTEQEGKERFEKMGQQAAAELTQGIERAAPKIRQAMNTAADATVDYTRKVEALKNLQKEHNDALERAVKLENNIGDQYDRSGQLAKEVEKVEKDLLEVRKSQDAASRGIATREANLRTKREEHAKTVEQLRKGELDLKQLRLDGEKSGAHELDQELMEVRRKNAAETAYLAKKELELAGVRDELGRRKDATQKVEEDLTAVRREHASTVKDLNETEKELGKTRETASRTDREIIRGNEEVDRSTRKREESLRRLIESERGHEESRGRSGRGGGGGFGGGAGNTLGQVFTSLPFVPGGPAGAAIGLTVLPFLGSLVESVVTASQALALLPAAGAAAGAGLLTVTLGFDGLGKAIKDVEDPKKFAKDLSLMGPAAQQVALEIQSLIQGPIKDLKAATEASLFDGVPQALHSLTDTFLPSIQQMTTGIGSAMNNMFKQFAGQLTTPESLYQINDIIRNIVTSFQNLVPAVAPFVDALTKITQTGSTFLPGLATSIADTAKSFDDFITKAQQTGDLQNFIQQGIEAAKTLGGVLFELGRQIYEVFGMKDPAEFKKNLETMADALVEVSKALVGLANFVNTDVLPALRGVSDLVGGWGNLFEIAAAGIIAWKAMGVISTVLELAAGLGTGGAAGIGVSGALAGIPALAETAGASMAPLAAALAAIVVGIPLAFDGLNKLEDTYAHSGLPGSPYPSYTPKDSPPLNPNNPTTQNDLGGLLGDAPPGGGPPPRTPAAPPGTQPSDPLAPGGILSPTGPFPSNYIPPAPLPQDPPPLGTPFQPFDVPTVAGTQSKTEQIAAARAALNPNDFAVNPFDGMPAGYAPTLGASPGGSGSPIGGPGSGADVGPLQYGTGGKPYAKAGLGYQSVNDDQVTKANQKLTEDGWQLTDAKLNLAALEKTGLGTQQEILDARHKVTKAEWDLNNDQRALLKDQEGHWNKVSAAKNGQLGPGLDPDLGLSKGLSGFVDNMIRAIGSAALAPQLAKWQAETAADPIQGGYGMLGIQGAQNMAQGLSPVLGRPYGTSAAGGYGGATASAGGIATGGGYPGDAALLSQIPSSGRYDSSGDLAKGLGDCSSAVEDLVNIMDGRSTAGRNMNTGTEAAWLTQHGFVPGMGGPGDFRVGFNPEHTQATLPGGTPVNFGNTNGYTNSGIGSSGADDPAFTSHYYRPTNGYAGLPVGPGMEGLQGGGPGGAVQSVYVVNMPGGGLGGPAGPPIGGPGAPPGGPAAGGAGTPGSPTGPTLKDWIANGNPVNGGGTPPGGGIPAAGGNFSPADLEVAKQRMAEGPLTPKTLTPYPENKNGYTPEVVAALKSLQNAPPTPPTPALVPTGTPFSPGNIPGPFAPIPGGAGPVDGGLGFGGAAGLGVPPQFPISAGGGQSPVLFGTPGAGPLHMGGGAAPGPQTPGVGTGPLPGPTQPGGAAGPQQIVGRASGEGGWQSSGPGAGADGGIAGAAAQAAASAFPGAGQLAATGTKLANRAIQYGGQLGAIGIEGLMETFLPSGSSLGDPSKSWAGRLLGGLSQAKPATPTSAGQTQAPLQPDQQQQQQGGGAAVHIENFIQAEGRNGQQAAQDLAFQSQQANMKRN